MNRRFHILLLAVICLNGTLRGQGETPASTDGPNVADISRMIKERDRGNWRVVLDYFEKYKPDSESVTADNVAVWDAYLQLRVESYFERSQQWKTKESIRLDAKRAADDALEYFNWYLGLSTDVRKGLPLTPASSGYAKATAPGRIRFGVAIYGNALLALAQPTVVMDDFAARPDDWFGDEGFRIWIAAAVYNSDSSRDGSEMARILDSFSKSKLQRTQIVSFSDKLASFVKRWAEKNTDPVPERWKTLSESLQNWLRQNQGTPLIPNTLPPPNTPLVPNIPSIPNTPPPR